MIGDLGEDVVMMFASVFYVPMGILLTIAMIWDI